MLRVKATFFNKLIRFKIRMKSVNQPGTRQVSEL